MLWWQWLEVKLGCLDVGEWKAGQLCLKIAAYEWGDNKIIPAGICDELITTELTICTAGCVVNTDGPCEHCVHQEFIQLTYWSSWLICWNSQLSFQAWCDKMHWQDILWSVSVFTHRRSYWIHINFVVFVHVCAMIFLPVWIINKFELLNLSSSILLVFVKIGFYDRI